MASSLDWIYVTPSTDSKSNGLLTKCQSSPMMNIIITNEVDCAKGGSKIHGIMLPKFLVQVPPTCRKETIALY